MNPKIMCYGDTHGDTKEHLRLIGIAADFGIQKMYQMGDCGFFTAFRDTWIGIERVQTVLANANITDHWVRGNHDDPDEWDHICNKYPRSKHGWGVLRENIFLAPRVHYFKHNKRRFLAVGGAVSIDKAYRLSAERAPGTLWWPNEIITDEDVDNVQDRKIDVLFTHDCSNRTPFWGRLKPDLDSMMNRQRVDQILEKAKPDFHFHGHMHTKYEWDNPVTDDHYTITYGLECNPKAMRYGGKYVRDDKYENWGIFDTDTMEFTWGVELV